MVGPLNVYSEHQEKKLSYLGIFFIIYQPKIYITISKYTNKDLQPLEDALNKEVPKGQHKCWKILFLSPGGTYDTHWDT